MLQENGESLMSLLTLVTLADLHHNFGLISFHEYEERCRIAEWLYGGFSQHADPRDAGGEEREPEDGNELPSGNATVTVQECDPDDPDSPGYLSFLFDGWVFTKADPDPYPSTPHGHWQHQNNKWPKLDPYNGRVFTEKHREDASKRLKKAQMKILWGDEKFKDFCRGHLIWYMEACPHHVFRVGRDRILRFPRW